MIMLDNTIVAVATPAILVEFNSSVDTVLWATSAYLLAYAVPLLITGRLGDRYGPRRLYLIGLSVFIVASLACALAGSIEALIAARVLQGLGAALLTPQTMALITRTINPADRGKAMAIWGATVGIATLLGPVVGGVLVDAVGWEWIFLINLPIGLIGLAAAWRFVPVLTTSPHRFDWIGVALSAVGMFLIVFGVQEGDRYDWGTVAGPVTIPALIGAGLLTMAVFAWWQARTTDEPLVPLSLFRDRNFTLSILAISTVSFAIMSIALPFMFYAQAVRGASPAESGMLLAPMAIVTAALSPYVGGLVDRAHPRAISAVGFVAAATGLFWLSQVMTPDGSLAQILIAMAIFGVGNAFLWTPIGATVNRNLPLKDAGAGSGVFNTVRQTSAVLGTAAIAVTMQSKISAALGETSVAAVADPGAADAALPASALEPFSAAMADTLLVPAGALCLGLLIVMFYARPLHARVGH